MPSLNSKKEKKSNKEKKSSSVSQIKVHVYDIPPQTTLQQMKTVLESLNLNSPDDYEILYYLQGSLVKSSTSSLYLTCQTEKKAIKLIDTLNKYKIDNNSNSTLIAEIAFYQSIFPYKPGSFKKLEELDEYKEFCKKEEEADNNSTKHTSKLIVEKDNETVEDNTDLLNMFRNEFDDEQKKLVKDISKKGKSSSDKEAKKAKKAEEKRKRHLKMYKSQIDQLKSKNSDLSAYVNICPLSRRRTIFYDALKKVLSADEVKSIKNLVESKREEKKKKKKEEKSLKKKSTKILILKKVEPKTTQETKSEEAAKTKPKEAPKPAEPKKISPIVVNVKVVTQKIKPKDETSK